MIKISEISLEMSKHGNILPGNIFAHCSGVLTSEIMSAVKVKDAFVASIHPMTSFSKPEIAVKSYKNTYCAFEGDPEALNVIKPLFRAIGSSIYEINKIKNVYIMQLVFLLQIT